ncbi:C-myc promoter-binding protein-like isoform X3 [Watersipora subatra]|uniref:C-myc promoter-binding protein-like isoform X3 n=1 Tax=Watersipora subatra TaxID=2589382 RepID=UPI00355BB8CB
MSGRRVADYFMVVGLPKNPSPLDLSSEGQLKPTSKNEPITDVCVIIPNEGEECPPGYKPLLETPTGHIADLNHGSIRSPEIFICFRRGRDKSPLTDIGVLIEGSERVLQGCEVLYTTPYGRPANINNTSNRIYLTYRRASETASSDILAVTGISVINASKGEKPPHSYCKIDKNLNHAMMSSSIFLCYKKSMCKDYSIAYKPAVLSRYPMWDWPDLAVPSDDSVAMFGLPMGALLESWPEKAAQAKPVFATFVLTLFDGKKVYGAAVHFYELFDRTDSLAAPERKALGLHLKKKRLVHVNKAICILSRRPFFRAFRNFLMYLHDVAVAVEPSNIQIERLIAHFMWEVPYPSPQRPRIQALLSETCLIEINLPDESPIPLSGASFMTMLKNLGVENTVTLLTATLLEKKILIHSLRPAVLTGVIEAVGTMIFPFSWKCPYIPLCPLGLTQMLFAPVPYIFGVDSRYFDLYDPPQDVTCFDLDTNTISKPSDSKLLPKRPTKVLRATLENLYYKIVSEQHGTVMSSEKQVAAENAMELLIQEAFLRFMAAMLKGYKNFLLPITSAPSEVSTSVKNLFDIKGFIKSRDKAYHKLYEQLVRTQAFASFIEERSFNMRNDTSLLFFDECAENVDENYDTPKLLEPDPYKSGHTVFVTPPLPDESQGTPVTYQYGTFPSRLDLDLFPHREKPESLHINQDKPTPAPDANTFIAKRSKAEVKAGLKLASVSRKGVAASTLWAKCLVNNTFSMWFAHLPAFIQVSNSPKSAMRAANIVLKKTQEYRLHTPDEICYRTMMQLCGIYKLPILAVKVLCEMRRIGLNANAITYGYYNTAVLESKWPEEASNALEKWRKLRHLIRAVSQFRRPVKARRPSIDADSLSRGSGNSGELVLETADLTSAYNKVDGNTAAADIGYSSMSHEDIRKCSNTKTPLAVSDTQNAVFCAKVGSIIKMNLSGDDSGTSHNITGSHLANSAGLLMTAKRTVWQLPLGGSLNTGSYRTELSEAKKRHKSAGDQLRRSQLVEEAENEDEKAVSGHSAGDKTAENMPLLDIAESRATPTSQTVVDGNVGDGAGDNISLDNDYVVQPQTATLSQISKGGVLDPLSLSSITTDIYSQPFQDDPLKKKSVVSDDPLGLFSNSDVEQSTPKADDTPSSSQTSSITSMDVDKLFGRGSTTATDSEVKKYNLLELSPDEPPASFPSQPLRKSVSLDSHNSYKAALQEEGQKVAELTSEISTPGGRSAKDNSSKDSLSNANLEDATNGSSYKGWVTASLKKSASGFALTKNLSKMKSMVYGEKPKAEPANALSSRESLDSIGSTPKSIKNRNEDMRASLKKIKSVSSSVASKLMQATTANYKHLKHTVKEYHTPSTVSTPYKDDKASDAKSNEDNISLLSSHSGLGVLAPNPEEGGVPHDDGDKPFDVRISYNGISAAFMYKYLPPASGHDAPDSLFDFTHKGPVLSVVICSATLCEHCSAILYDENIMAGWSAQDSDLSTTCRFCDRKQVPFLQIEIKDLRVKGNNKPASDDTCFSTPPLTPRSDTDTSREPIKLPYLSPLVLRKELEIVLDREGDVALTHPDFVDNHSIVYWNLMWYFKRMNVPSHLPQLLFQSKTLQLDDMHTASSAPCDISLRVVWDNPRLHDAMATPMYKLWKDSAKKSTMVRALVTEDMSKSKQFMQQILTNVGCSDMCTPLRQILCNRRLQSTKSTLKCHSAYRDILFLSFAHFGRDAMDHDAFDREYKFAYKKLLLTDKELLHITDSPPTPTVMWCRKLFGHLDVT